MVTVTTPEEALVLVPHILGYRPTSTFVMCGLDSQCADAAGTGLCVGPIVHLDYRNEPLSADHGRFLAQVTRRHDVTIAVLVLYCQSLSELDVGGLAQRIALMHSMVSHAQRPGAALFSFAVDAERFVRLDGGSRAVRDARELESCATAAELVFQGSAPGAEQPGMALPAVDPRMRAAARAAADAAIASGGGETAAQTLWDLFDAAQAHGVLFRGNVSGCAPEGAEGCARALAEANAGTGRLGSGESLARAVGQASASLTVPLNRDAALAWGLEPSLRRGGDADAQAVAEILAEAVCRPPSISRLKTACRVLDLVAAYECRGSVDALAASAYLHWWACLNSIAADRVERALGKDPGHSLTRLLADALASGMMAPWYFYARGAA